MGFVGVIPLVLAAVLLAASCGFAATVQNGRSFPSGVQVGSTTNASMCSAESDEAMFAWDTAGNHLAVCRGTQGWRKMADVESELSEALTKSRQAVDTDIPTLSGRVQSLEDAQTNGDVQVVGQLIVQLSSQQKWIRGFRALTINHATWTTALIIQFPGIHVGAHGDFWVGGVDWGAHSTVSYHALAFPNTGWMANQWGSRSEGHITSQEYIVPNPGDEIVGRVLRECDLTTTCPLTSGTECNNNGWNASCTKVYVQFKLSCTRGGGSNCASNSNQSVFDVTYDVRGRFTGITEP